MSQHSVDSLMWDQIELLVENELSSDARRALLLKLDHNPAMWRSLALAFVERQALSVSIEQVCGDGLSLTDDRQAPVQPKFLRSNSAISNSLTRYLSAASILVAAMLLAFMFGVSRNAPNNSADSGMLTMGEHEQRVDTADSDQGTIAHGQDAPVVQSDSTKLNDHVVGYVEWIDRYGRRLSPVFRGSRIDDDWLKSHPPRVNQSMKETYARAGISLEPQRRFVSLTLAEGGQYTIPMDDITMRRVVREVY